MKIVNFDLRTTEYKDISIFPPVGTTFVFILSETRKVCVSRYEYGTRHTYYVLRMNGAKVDETQFDERYKLAAYIRGFCQRLNVNGKFAEQRQAERDNKERERLENKKADFEEKIAQLQSEYADFMKNEYIPVCGE